MHESRAAIAVLPVTPERDERFKEQLYARLHALHVRSVQAARSRLAFQGAHHA